MTYPIGDVWNQLITPGNTLRFQYEHLDNQDDTLGWLTRFITGCTITHDYTATIKRTAKFSLVEQPSVDFDFLNDRIRPWIGIQMPDGGWADYPQGVFLTSSPTRVYNRGLITREVDAYDKTKVLLDASFGTSDTTIGNYVIPAGTIYTDEIINLLGQSGILTTQIKIVESTQATVWHRIHSNQKKYKAHKAHYRHRAGDLLKKKHTLTRKLNSVHKLIQKLIVGINYEELWFDGYCNAIIEPYQEPDSADVDHLYEVSEESILHPEVDQTLDLFDIPNVIVLVVSQSDRPLLKSKFVNKDPNSPVSTVRRGRKIVHFDDSLDVASQSELDALAKQAAIGAANVYETVNISTMINPLHGNRDIVFLEHPKLGLSDKFMEFGWSIEMKAGGTMTHQLRRVVNLDAALVGDPDV